MTSGTEPARSSRPSRMSLLWRYALALAISVTTWGLVVVGASERPAGDPAVMWFLVGDPLLGVVSFVLIRWRHRRPALVGVVLGAVSMVSVASSGPSSWIIG